jgi:hypothetical protein
VTAATAPGGLTPAFFDAAGQPVAATKMSTVGTASATESVAGRTTTETETQGGDQDMMLGEDEDMISLDHNFRPGETEETEMDSVSGDLLMEDMASRSMGGFEDRMSDDGNASLVGFGEGAGSTVSGPIYHRRPLTVGSSAAAIERVAWGLERSSSGLSEGATLASARRDTVRGPEGLHHGHLLQGGERDSSVSYAAVMERREARMGDGVVVDCPATSTAMVPGVVNEDMFVDTTARGPVSIQPPTSALRDTQQPNSPYQQQQRQQQLQQQQVAAREAAERLTSGLDDGEAGVGNQALSSPHGNERLGRFYFEDHK